MYKVLTSNLNLLQRRITRITKKLDKHNLYWAFEILGESIEEVDVYKDDVQVGKELVDVTSYRFEMETLKLGSWTPIAIIEHDVVKNANITNMVHIIQKDEEFIDNGWWILPSNCEHCNSNRRRKKTVILRSEEGEYKQVGTTCVKDFTGIDAEDILSIYATISDIYIETPRLTAGQYGGGRYISTIDYLASCLDLVARFGYKKDETKFEAFQNAIEGEFDNSQIENAQQIIDFFENFNCTGYNTEFYLNVKAALLTTYTSVSGLIAYAPIAYVDALKMQKQSAASEWQGNVGDKVNLKLCLSKRFSYSSQYGTMMIYIFEDADGNIYKWNTSTCIDVDDNSTFNIAGTIKSHDTYNSQKQTVLTRCKVSNVSERS